MCKLFIGADADLWTSSTRSLRIGGMVTSVRLEAFFWSVLEEIARRDDMTVIQLIVKLYNESVEAGHDIGNFTSFLRVCCGRYLSLQLAGEVPNDLTRPISGLDAERILEAERTKVH